MSENLDPREAIIDFIKGQSASVQEDIYLQILLLVIGEKNIHELPSLSDPVIQYLSRSGYAGLGSVICAKTIIDRHIAGILEKLNFAELALKDLIANSDPDFPQHSLLSIPLKRKYYLQAIDSWKSLVAGPLSENNISYFERNPQELPILKAE